MEEKIAEEKALQEEKWTAEDAAERESSYQTDDKGRGLQRLFGNWFGLLLVIICGILIFYFISDISYLFQGLSYGIALVKPVLYGAVIAYLLNPLMKFYQKLLESLLCRKGKKLSKRMQKISYGISIALAMISGILIILVLIWMIVPQLITSIGSLVNTLPSQVDRYYQMMVERIQNNPYLADKMQDVVLEATKMFDDWIQNELFPWLQAEVLPNVNSFAFRFANGLMNVLGVLYNLFIGCIVAVYLLSGKETFLAQCKKMIYSIFGKKQADVILHYGRITNDMFSGFISGKIVDSTIIGMICFLAMWILKLPYALLVSVIVGVTNVIPVFGPYIGAVPSAFLILLVNPVQCFYFVVLIVILQQLDGNVIGPAILGESTGLTAFWVLFAILLFGGMWGIAGMLVGVPFFAVIYRLLKDYIEFRLHKKKLQMDTMSYVNLKKIRIDSKGHAHYERFTRKELHSASERRKSEEKITLTSILSQNQIQKQMVKNIEKTEPETVSEDDMEKEGSLD